MNKKIIILTVITLVLAIGSYKIAFALFSSQATSTNNTFAAAEVFPNSGIADHLVISEVQIDGGPSHADHDFIELYNPTNSSIDLNGHRLVSRTGNSSTDDLIKSFTSLTNVPAHGFYLWARNSDASFASGIGADASTSASLTNSMSIALRNGPDNTGTIVDALSWNEGATIGEGTNADASVDNGSLERKALSTSGVTSMTSGADVLKGNGFDANNNATDFIQRASSQPQNTGSGTETP